MKVIEILENKRVKFLILIGLALAGWCFGQIFSFDIERIQQTLSRYPAVLSGFIFVVVYVSTTTIVWFGPKDFFRIAAAILLGANTSTVLVWIAEMINSAIMFQLSRYLGRDYVVTKFKLRDKQLERVQKDNSAIWILALRLNLLVPLRLMDLGFGLSSVGLARYLWTTLGVTIFRIYLVQYLLAAAGISILRDPNVVKQLMMDTPLILTFAFAYVFIVFILTLTAIVLQYVKRKEVV